MTVRVGVWGLDRKVSGGAVAFPKLHLITPFFLHFPFLMPMHRAVPLVRTPRQGCTVINASRLCVTPMARKMEAATDMERKKNG